MLLKVRKQAQDFPHAWTDILKEFEHSRTKVKVTKVIWKFPQEWRIKYNIHGACRGKLGIIE